MQDIEIRSLRGGLNNTDKPQDIDDDQCRYAMNVEFWDSACGERRGGTTQVDLTDSGLTDEKYCTYLSQWLPTEDVTQPEWWALTVSPSATLSLARFYLGVWHSVTPIDTPSVDVPYIFRWHSKSLGGLNFFLYKSAVDRLHVWDGATFRVSGLKQPDPPTAANSGSGSYAATQRIYRVRFVEIDTAGKIRRKSEPSTELTITPSGFGTGITVTKPATISEGETHWDLEASDGDGYFWRIDRKVVATTTAVDSTTPINYPQVTGDVAEEIGSYFLLPSAKIAVIDDDRLILLGHQTDLTLQSQMCWTPRSNDFSGFGNSERLPGRITNTLQIDSGSGGPITGGTSGVLGVIYLFKWQAIYQVTRTNNISQAYTWDRINPAMGAIYGSVVEGLDEDGKACAYFLDPSVGPCRIGPKGVQTMEGIRGTWDGFNAGALVSAHGIYYHEKRQVIWWIATGGSTFPDLVIRCQVSEIVSSGAKCKRGWSTANGLYATAICSAVLTQTVFENGEQKLVNRPFIGLYQNGFIHRTDTGDDDNGEAFSAYIQTKHFLVAGLLNKTEILSAAVTVSVKNPAVFTHMYFRLIADLDAEAPPASYVLATQDAAVPMKVIDIDDLVVSGARFIGVEITDD